MSTINRAIKYRIEPNKEQREMFAKTFGCCRKIWNLMLADKIEHYNQTKEMLYNTPAQYKKEYEYLSEVDKYALGNVQLQLQQAYKNFFRHPNVGFPKFKSRKKARNTYTTNFTSNNIRIENGRIRLPKVGWVKIKLHRIAKQDWKLKSATVSQDLDGKYYVSVLYEYEEEISKSKGTKAIGLDYKSNGLYCDSNGKVCNNPHWYRESHKKLAKAQRKLSKKKEGSKNRAKAKIKVARISKHIANQRKDFLHKKSFEIANQYDIVCVENLNMKAMANKWFGNGKATLDNGWGMFVSQLSYKLHDRGKLLVKVDKWYPSSQICSKCGARHKMPLEVRRYECECGNRMDRDHNSAINILREGLRMVA